MLSQRFILRTLLKHAAISDPPLKNDLCISMNSFFKPLVPHSRIPKALNSCSASTGDIISTTERLKRELEITTQRQEIVSCFLHDYQLSNEEISAPRDEDLNENFFKALLHVHKIHANCKVLLRTHHQRAGLELMDMMGTQRLCRRNLCSSSIK